MEENLKLAAIEAAVAEGKKKILDSVEEWREMERRISKSESKDGFPGGLVGPLLDVTNIRQ